MRAIAVAALATAAALACAKPEPDPTFAPTRSVLEVVAVLERHVPDDTYRFEPARDFTGRNVYRSALLRLESLEQVHEASLRAGHMTEIVAFSKARALERLRAYAIAAAGYRRAAEVEGPLRAEARRSAALCEALSEATGLARPPDGTVETDAAFGERAAKRGALLEALLAEAAETHQAHVVREEIERADVDRVLRLRAERRRRPGGDVEALAALQRVVVAHRESKHANRHLLRLADLYATLAEEYVEEAPPESLAFDPPAFEELVAAATRLYEAVSNQDGASERLEAAQRLEAFLAFTLRVDRDRFTR